MSEEDLYIDGVIAYENRLGSNARMGYAIGPRCGRAHVSALYVFSGRSGSGARCDM